MLETLLHTYFEEGNSVLEIAKQYKICMQSAYGANQPLPDQTNRSIAVRAVKDIF